MRINSLIALHILVIICVSLALSYVHWALGVGYLVASAVAVAGGWPAIKAGLELYEELRSGYRNDSDTTKRAQSSDHCENCDGECRHPAGVFHINVKSIKEPKQ